MDQYTQLTTTSLLSKSCYSSVLQCVAICYCSLLLQYVAAHSVDRYIADVNVIVMTVCCSVLLQCVTVHSIAQGISLVKVIVIALCCTVLHCAAVCCSVLQCAAVCYSVLQCAAIATVCCIVLQCVVMQGQVWTLSQLNERQHTATTHCNNTL